MLLESVETNNSIGNPVLFFNCELSKEEISESDNV